MEQQHTKRGDPTPPLQHGTGLGDLDSPLRRRADVMLAGQKEAFELALGGAPLAATLDVLARTLEVQSDAGLLAGLLLRQEGGGSLQWAAAGGYSEDMREGLQALSVDGEGGPPGTALQDKALAGSADLGSDERWPDFCAWARPHGLRSAWALPVLSSDGEAVGVWLLQHRIPARLSEGDLSAALAAAQSAALLLEHEHRLRQRADGDRRHAHALSVLVHDLRNPLAPLRNTIELLHRAGAEPLLVERACTIMSRQVAQLARLMEELSEVSNALPQGELPADELPHPTGPGTQMSLAEDGAFADQPPGAMKVLVADDNELVRDSFVELLRAEGYEVRTAADGVQAVELADQWRPQAVLLDIHMPRLSGLETARRLREAYPPSAMALLMMSGMTLNDAWLRHAKAAGFDDCVDKTSDPKLWLERLRAALPQH
jgi:CheY-like chemotaxis protein/GAF domain-containing protein